MKRPLAVFGFTFLLTLLAVAKQPTAALLPLALLPAVLFICLLFFARHRVVGQYLLVVTAALTLALLYKPLYDGWVTKPTRQLVDKEAAITARVDDVQPSFGGDTFAATVKVQQTEGYSGQPYKLLLQTDYEPRIGDVITTTVRFYSVRAASSRYQAAKGVYINARPISDVAVDGQALTPLCRLRLVRYKLGDALINQLPMRLSSVQAAMTVGDRRHLTDDTQLAYRAAGLSHMLVVSGLHLSVLTSLLLGGLNKLFRKRCLTHGITIGFVLLFALFTGLTPSIVRSAIMAVFLLLAPLFAQRADAYTSIAFAGLVLCFANPYAAVDMGLQLSFAATLGIVSSNTWLQRPGRKRFGFNSAAANKLAYRARKVLVPPVFVTFFTLPVLALNGAGVALLSIPFNVVAVPLLAPILVCGFVMALFVNLPLLKWLTLPASLVSGTLLVLLEKLTAFAERQRFNYLPISGGFALFVIAVIYGLVVLAVYTNGTLNIKKRRKNTALFSVSIALVLAISAFSHTALNKNIVRLTVCRAGQNNSIVVTQNSKAAVIYLGKQSASSIQRVFQQQRIESCELFIDLRKTAQSTEYNALFKPQKVVTAAEDIASHHLYSVLNGAEIAVQKQQDGAVACVDIGGYKVATTNGEMDLTPYAPPDILVAGNAPVKGRYGTLFATTPPPDWPAENDDIVIAIQPEIWIRPGKSILIKEVETVV